MIHCPNDTGPLTYLHLNCNEAESELHSSLLLAHLSIFSGTKTKNFWLKAIRNAQNTVHSFALE